MGQQKPSKQGNPFLLQTWGVPDSTGGMGKIHSPRGEDQGQEKAQHSTHCQHARWHKTRPRLSSNFQRSAIGGLINYPGWRTLMDGNINVLERGSLWPSSCISKGRNALREETREWPRIPFIGSRSMKRACHSFRPPRQLGRETYR